MTEERPSDAEITAIVAEVEAAGLLTIGVDAVGRATRAPTPMGSEVDGATLLDATGADA